MNLSGMTFHVQADPSVRLMRSVALGSAIRAGPVITLLATPLVYPAPLRGLAQSMFRNLARSGFSR